MNTRLFTISEANELLPLLTPKLEAVSDLYSRIELLRVDARAAAAASSFGGGMAGGTGYVNMLYQIGKLTTELFEVGIQVKDPKRGLIDFPSIRAGREVFLCWQIGDEDEIAWWHETDTGFAGRQPL